MLKRAKYWKIILLSRHNGYGVGGTYGPSPHPIACRYPSFRRFDKQGLTITRSKKFQMLTVNQNMGLFVSYIFSTIQTNQSKNIKFWRKCLDSNSQNIAKLVYCHTTRPVAYLINDLHDARQKIPRGRSYTFYIQVRLSTVILQNGKFWRSKNQFQNFCFQLSHYPDGKLKD